MSSIDVYAPDGSLSERWDYDSRLYTRYSGGVSVESRSFTEQENADADAHIAELNRLSLQSQALGTLATLAGQVQVNVLQAQSDANAWATADAATRDEIMGRVLTGLGQITEALGQLAIHLGIGS